MKIKLLSFTIALFSLIACSKDGIRPYSIFKNTNYEMIGGIISVDLGSNYQLIIDNGYEISNPDYFSQINNDNPQAINSSLLLTEVHGWNGREGLNFETVRVTLNFNSNNFNSGDKLKIISRHSSIEESILFEIE